MKMKQHLCLTLLLAAAPTASAQAPAPVAPPAIEPLTPDATPGPSPSPAKMPRNAPELAAPPADEPAAADPVPAPATGTGGARRYERPVPNTPREVKDSLPAPVPVPVAPAPRAAGASNRYFEERAPAATPAPARLPAHPRDRAEQIIRDTKLKVLQGHYETALSELMAVERALIDATDDKRPAMETRLKGLKGFVEKLEAEIKTLAAGPASDAPAGTGGDGNSRPRRIRTSATPQPPANVPEDPTNPADDVTRGTLRLSGSGAVALVAPEEELPAPGTIRMPAPRGIIIDREGREIRLHPQDEAAEPAPARR